MLQMFNRKKGTHAAGNNVRVFVILKVSLAINEVQHLYQVWRNLVGSLFVYWETKRNRIA
jgi:hypothetical protein